jgi:hypothetical protein
VQALSPIIDISICAIGLIAFHRDLKMQRRKVGEAATTSTSKQGQNPQETESDDLIRPAGQY